MMEVTVLQKGQSFGELALISNKPRAATVKCLSDSHFLVLHKQDYQRVLGRLEESTMNVLVDFLKQMPQFSNWFKAALSKLTYFFHKEKFKRNQFIFKEGDPCT